jgi:hypothetical protein
MNAVYYFLLNPLLLLLLPKVGPDDLFIVTAATARGGKAGVNQFN